MEQVCSSYTEHQLNTWQVTSLRCHWLRPSMK